MVLVPLEEKEFDDSLVSSEKKVFRLSMSLLRVFNGDPSIPTGWKRSIVHWWFGLQLVYHLSKHYRLETPKIGGYTLFEREPALSSMWVCAAFSFAVLRFIAEKNVLTPRGLPTFTFFHVLYLYRRYHWVVCAKYVLYDLHRIRERYRTSCAKGEECH